MDGCSDAYNLTDCLLLSLLDAMKDHNKWDVPSLSVTAVIGLIALVFAAMTLTQGVLSAASGHRKCSKDAIGDWSNKTESRWNWAEFRWDSIANTPVLTSAIIQDILDKQPALPQLRTRNTSGSTRTLKSFVVSIWSENEATIGQNGKGSGIGIASIVMQKLKRVASSKSTTKDRVYPATWLHLLEHVGMKKFVLKNLQHRTRSTAADYLPSIVQAVPAYMDVDTIIALGATAGCDKLIMEPESGYPRLVGTDVQIQFRRDPFLGVVAFFEHYASAVSEEKHDGPLSQGTKPPANKSESKFDTSRGNFRTYSKKFREVNDQGSEPGHPLQISAGVAEPHLDGRALVIRVPDGSLNDEDTCGLVGNLELCGCWTLLSDLTRRHSFFWLLYGKIMDQRYIFPAKAANVEEALGTLIIQGWYWSRINSTPEGWIYSLLEEEDSKGVRFEARNYQSFLNYPLSWEIFALCQVFAADVGAGQRIFRRFPYTRRGRIRAAISKEIDEIDDKIKALDGKRGSRSQCTMIEIYITAATIMSLEHFEELMTKELYGVASSSHLGSDSKPKIGIRPRNVLRLLKDINAKEGPTLIKLYDYFLGLFNDCWAVEVDVLIRSLFALASAVLAEDTPSAKYDGVDPTKHAADAKSPVGSMMALRDPMRELLIYRAVLLSIVCLTSLDNSDVLKSDIGNQIVTFL